MDQLETIQPRYYSKDPLFTKDPCHKETNLTTKVGDYLGWARHIFLREDKVNSWFYESDLIPYALQAHVNIATHLTPDVTVLLPQPLHYFDDGSVAYMIYEDEPYLLYKPTKTQLVTIDLSKYRLDDVQNPRVYGFLKEYLPKRVENTNLDDWDFCKDVTIAGLCYHPQMLQKASRLINAKMLNSFNNSSFINLFKPWLEDSVFYTYYVASLIGPELDDYIIKLGVYVFAQNQKSLNATINNSKKTLSEQKDTL